MINNTFSELRRRMNIGKTKRMFEDGMTVTEIAAALKLPESTVRSYVAIIETAKKNKEIEGS